MSLKPVTTPSEEPVSLQEARAHLRLESREDEYLTNLITAAQRHCESFLGRALITQTWDLMLDCFPADEIEIPLPPLQSITYVKYKDTAGVLQTLDISCYIVDANSQPGRVSPAYGQSWPSTYDEIQSVQIRFVAGYGAAADVPQSIKSAILIKLADLYEHRGDETASDTIDRAIQSLLWPDRIVPL
jgi:uncharacterized phiE125 gp8 family phage protein